MFLVAVCNIHSYEYIKLYALVCIRIFIFSDALIGIAVLGGIGGVAAIAIGGLIGVALSKK